jgi:septation ring formation regulator EzrA
VGITSSALSKAQATVSTTQAEVDELEADLATANTKLKLLQSADKTVDTLTGPVAEHAGFARRRSEAAVSQARADVDEITAKLEAAKTKHSMAVSVLSALQSLTDD